MAVPTLRQSQANAVGSGQSRTCTVTMDTPTKTNNLLVVAAVCTHGGASFTINNAGFTLLRDTAQGDLRVAVWYWEGAPSLSTVSVSVNQSRALQVRVLEYDGARQTGALDQVVVLSSNDASCDTGTTGNTAQADSIVVSCVANRYASCTQYGFIGGLTRLFESVTPDSWGWFGYDYDEFRSRLTVHHTIASLISAWRLQCLLSSWRDWIAVLCTFKGASSGPSRLTSAIAPPAIKHGGSAGLTAFGPLKATLAPAALVAGGRADMYPFNYQYRVNWAVTTRALIGTGTDYPVAAIEGLEGWQLRTSDDDLPRNDGAIRGIDLQSARQVLFTLGMGSTGINYEEVEDKLRDLYRALIPRRDSDFELVWRHPGQPVKMIRCRPIDLVRGLDQIRALFQDQKFALKASDPRHYGPLVKTVGIAVTPAGSAPVPTEVINSGDANAYPLIRIVGAPSGTPLTRIELVNNTAGVSFDVLTTIPSNSLLIGDMDARITSAPRSVITLDGQTKYGAWQLPRDPLFIAPDPAAVNGSNLLYLKTTPAGAAVTCTVEYRDTWNG